MVINTEKIQKNAKLIESSLQSKNVYQESVYLDFETSYLYFTNDFYTGRVRFDFDPEPEDDIQNFFVDGNIFLSLCKQYNEINVNNEKEFYVDNEQFKVSTFTADEFLPPAFDYEELEVYSFDKSLVKYISTALSFISPDKPELKGIGFQGNSIISTDRTRILEITLPETEIPQIDLPDYVAKLITLIASNEDSVNVLTNGEGIYITVDKDIEIHAPGVVNLSLPDMSDPNFKTKFDHPRSLVIEKAGILEVLSFLSVFVKNVINEKLYCKITQDGQLSVEVRENILANRVIPIRECDEDFLNTGFWISRPIFLSALRVIADDFIRIKLDYDQPAFDVVGASNETVHVAMVRLV